MNIWFGMRLADAEFRDQNAAYKRTEKAENAANACLMSVGADFNQDLIKRGEEVAMEFGVLIISFVVLIITFFIFGRNLGNTFGARFLYWLQSTMVLAPLLFAWFVYIEPAALSTIGASMSVGLAAAFAVGRSCFLTML